MRYAFKVLVTLGLLVVADTAWGKRPPMTCPTDLAAGVEEACPCDGKLNPDTTVTPWKSHGQYVSCSVRYRNALRKNDCAPREELRLMARCAARSTCGKPEGTVVCCFSDTGTCVDPTPGDATPATCSNDSEVSCSVDADCTSMHGRVRPDDVTCTTDGGTPMGGGSVCSACTPPAPPAP